jgi:arsenite methyltransferase
MPIDAMDGPGRDIRAEWLLHRRYGGDPSERQRALDYLYPVRDKVLSNANLREGTVLLDVGTGDGLIAFGALQHVGTTGQVILSDISQDLLDLDKDLARRMGVIDCCQFLHAAADDLSAIGDATVDAVTTLSVLIYVADKQRSFDEFWRVLRPGGHVSLFEPINRYSYDADPSRLWGFDVSPVQDIAGKIHSVYGQHHPIETDPMMNFDERDLLAFAERAGFDERHLELHVDITRRPPRPWETFVHTAFNPKIPTLAEVMESLLTREEADSFVAQLRPQVEQGQGYFPLAVAYLWAVKP